jgi:hypothetical protein|tara:strand:- start:220 stop:396 length:177 start_codon:yes stop_codon:yes gene_type:complete
MSVLGEYAWAILLFWPTFRVAVGLKKNINIKGMPPARETSTLYSYDHASKMKQIELIR